MKRLVGLLQRYAFANTSLSFWHTPIDQVRYDYVQLDDYYIDLSAKCSYTGPFDGRGVPLLDYKGSIGTRYNPCAVAQYALGHFQTWQRKASGANAVVFHDMVDWLVDAMVVEDGRGFWTYDFDLDAYGVTAPWKSGLAQAQAISVLARSIRFPASERKRRDHEDALALAYAGLVEPVRTGGLLRTVGTDVWIEEVVADRLVAILDGSLFALFGVLDYADLTGSTSAESLFTQGCETITGNLRRFDLGYWSRADLYQQEPPMPASAFYHNLHIHQLRALHERTGNETFARTADRWDEYQRSWMNRKRALANKVAFKLRYY